MIILFFSLLSVVYFDARLLNGRDPERYRRIMQFPAVRWALYATFGCLAMLPIYLLRRQRFFEASIGFDVKETKLADAFEVLLKWFCGVMLFVVGLKMVTLVSPGLRGSLLAVLLISGFSSFWLVWLMAQLPRRPGRPEFSTMVAAHKPANALRCYGLAVGTGLMFALISSYILFSRTQSPATPLGDALQVNDSSVAFLLFIVLGLVAAPLLEELIFRGYFFGVLADFKGTRFAILVIAGLFAALHVGQYWGDPMAILIVTLLGLAITLLRAWSGSMIPGVVTHYVYNTLVCVLPVVFLMISNPAYVKYMAGYQQLDVKAKEGLLLESIHTRPEFAEAYNDLAWLYAENRIHLDEALKFSERALTHEPDNAAFLDTKAEVLFLMGKKEEAMTIGRRNAERFPRSDYYLGQLRKFEGAPNVPAGHKPGLRRR